MLLTFFIPILFCPLGTAASLIVGAAFALDASRSVVERIVLRREHLSVITRGSMGRNTCIVAWSDLASVVLESEERGPRSRDALMVRWATEEGPRWVRIGLGRRDPELVWMRDLLRELHTLLDVGVTVDQPIVGDATKAALPDEAVADT